MLKFDKHRYCEHVLSLLVGYCVCHFFGRDRSSETVVGYKLDVLVHLTGSTVEARVEKHKSLQRHHSYETSFEVFNVQRVDLPLKLLCHNKNMLVTHSKLIKKQIVVICDRVYQNLWFKRRQKWVFFRSFVD